MWWQVEGIINFGPNVARFFMTSGSRRWYVVGAYVPPHDLSDFCRIDQALEVALKGMEVILLVYLNIKLREPRDNKEGEFKMSFAGSGLTDVISHFIPRGWY